MRAIEFIHEAGAERIAQTTRLKELNDFQSKEEYVKNLRQAIRCLVLAIYETL